MRNGDRWQVNSGSRDELNLTNANTGHRITIPADYVAAGNVSVDYASTINRAQGATVDEAHLLLGDRTNTKQLYVGTTRGRAANHIHTAPPAFDPDQHGPDPSASEWTPQGAVTAALARQPDDVSALERRRQLREFQSTLQQGNDEPSQKPIDDRDETARQRATDVASRLRHFTIRRSQGLTR